MLIMSFCNDIFIYISVYDGGRSSSMQVLLNITPLVECTYFTIIFSSFLTLLLIGSFKRDNEYPKFDGVEDRFLPSSGILKSREPTLLIKYFLK